MADRQQIHRQPLAEECTEDFAAVRCAAREAGKIVAVVERGEDSEEGARMMVGFEGSGKRQSGVRCKRVLGGGSYFGSSVMT